MSGETENQVSGWTVDTLHSHMLGLLSQIDMRYAQQFVDQQRAVDLAVASAEKAVSKAESAQEKRLDALNELRGALDDALAANVSRAEHVAAIANVSEKLTDLATRFDRFEARTMGATAGAEATRAAAGQLRTLIIGAATVVVAAIGVAVTIILAAR